MISKIYSKNEQTDELEVVEIIKIIFQKYTVPSFTQLIMVERGAIPHSHPILTLNTRVRDERLIFATLIHEQLHWYAKQLPNYNECISYLKTKYQDDGEHNKSGDYPNSYWEHIIACLNTRAYLKQILSDEDIKWIYDQWQPYPTLEKLISEKYQTIKAELENLNAVLLV